MNNYLINLLNCISFFTFFYIFFSELNHSKSVSILAILIESCITFAFTSHIGYLSNKNIPYDLFTLVTVTLFQLFLFDDRHHSKIALIAIFVLFLNLLHNLFSSVLAITFIPFLHISIRSEAVSALFQMISLYAFYIFAKYLHPKRLLMDSSVLSDFSLILLIPFCLSYSIQYLYFQYKTTDLLILLLLSILLDIVMIIILIKKIHDLEIIQHERITSSILEQTEKQFHIMLNNENKIRNIRHDMKNHLTVIQSLCSEHKFQEVTFYINQLTESINVNQNRIYCDNVYLNTILNSKVKQHKDIHFSILILSLPHEIESIDLCILIANLLDNAITELGNHTELKKNITLKIYGKGNFQFIIVQNPLSQIKNLITEKADISKHGLGLSIVQGIVDKYNGQFLIQQEDLFTITIMFAEALNR